MRCKNVFMMFPAIIALVSCDYYNSAMDYKDSAALQQIDLRDNTINRRETANILELNGYCFFKKSDVWVLLNGRSKEKIKVLNEKPLPCMEKKDMKWARIVCEKLTNEDESNLMKITCKK